jgi:UDP-N-acetylmuramoyl-L-alanyl-D-glutamate--2,6-diaminopimelate ligase
VEEQSWKGIAPVLKSLGAKESAAGVQDLMISGVAYDSRQVLPGNAFVCIAGEQSDGNNFIGDAVKSGASCIFSELDVKGVSVPYFQVPDVRLALALLADGYFDHPSRKLRPLGVTGTNGKTTTTHLVEEMLNSAGRKTGLIGTLGARWPGQSVYRNIKHTTPQSADLHGILSGMAGAACSHVAMEVSSHALAQKRVAGCHFAVACMTNITQDHLDFHQTMEHYWMAKRKLFAELNDSTHASRTAIVNRDDALAEQFLEVCGPGVRKLTYGWSAGADLYVKAVHFDFSGTSAVFATPAGDVELKLRLNGRFNVYNTMAALLICLSEGVELDACVKALEEFPGVSGRFETVSSNSGGEPLVIVDYAHTPDGLDNVLKTARNLVPEGGKLVGVFGCGGDRDTSKRPQMGEIAESLCDQVVVTSDNPRSEDPQTIIADILAGIKRTRSVHVEPDRAAAIRLAIQSAGDSDVIVVAGKGHENYQILADRTIPFDDRTEVQLALKEREAAAQLS